VIRRTHGFRRAARPLPPCSGDPDHEK
jgi:hypothetical protein